MKCKIKGLAKIGIPVTLLEAHMVACTILLIDNKTMSSYLALGDWHNVFNIGYAFPIIVRKHCVIVPTNNPQIT